MNKVKIKIEGVYDITRFVEEANKVRPGVNVYKGNIMLDGTSLVGMLSLDTKNGIDVEYPEDALDFEQFLIQFM